MLMMLQKKDKRGQLTTVVEDDDQCMRCEFFCKGVSCPLLESLAVGVAVLTSDVTVKNCGFFSEFARPSLSVVSDGTKGGFVSND